jgi:hypothetical protein
MTAHSVKLAVLTGTAVTGVAARVEPRHLAILGLQTVIPAQFINIRKIKATIANTVTLAVHSKTNQPAWRSQGRH